LNTRKLHRVLGLIMLLPLAAWAVTGAIFFIKPGYGAAYDALAIKTYPLGTPVALETDPAWLEVRYLKTILGEHLLARTSGGWQHLDVNTRKPKPMPDEVSLRTLLTDAFSANPARYGAIVSVDGAVATTDTGARVTLAWNRLALSQRGKDTDRIDGIYKIHYLQWTGVPAIDQILGGVGLLSVLLLSALGLRLFLRR
jgi:hypothetical protein